MTIQELRKLRETEHKVEFKEAKQDFSFAGGSHTNPSERRKCVLGYVVALANGGGGYLVFGVREKKELPHEIVGTTFAEDKTGALEDEIYKRLSIRVKIEELFDNDKRVLVFNIPPRPIGSTLKFNEDAIREAILNAIGHRLWNDLSSVVIKQYPDRINIINAGGFPSGVTKNNILTVNSKPRNKLVMEVLEKTGLVERSGQGVDKIYYNCLMEGKPLPDYSRTDDYHVDLCLRAEIVDEAFYIFVNEIQDHRKEENKLNVFDLLTLDKVRQGISTDLFEESVEKLQHEGLIKSQSSADRKYVLGDLYYEIAKQSAYIKEYRVKDLQIVASCFERTKEVSMKDFVNAFDNQLSREQVRYLVSKLEENQLIERLGRGRSIKYRLNKNKDIKKTVFEYFNEKLSE